MASGLDLAASALFALAAVVSAAIGALVLRSSGESVVGRRLAALLLAESLLSGANAYLVLRDESTRDGFLVLILLFAVFWVIGGLYLLVLATLPTRLVAALRQPWAPRAVSAATLASLAFAASLGIALLAGVPVHEEGSVLATAFTAWVAAGMLLLVVGSLFGLVAAVASLRQTAEGTPARDRAVAFLVAFGIRDFTFLYVFLLGETLGELLPEGSLLAAIASGGEYWIIPVGSVLFVAALAYGLLRTQLFDLDLKIKLGISRATVASIILVAVFVGAKIVESYLNRTAGFVAGSIVAGALLFVVPKLNKVGDRIANTAMPNVQPTSGYVQFKKLEVYRAAVESAYETGGVGERERASLDRLRTKLGLDAGDCAAVEAEAAGAPSQTT